MKLDLNVLAGIAIIALVAFLAYLSSINGGFVLDDNLFVTENNLIQTSDGLHKLWCTAESEEYYPVSYSTLWIDWRLWGMKTTGYRVINLILHIVEALLIWAILRKLSIPGAFLAAAIFVVHPVNVESVAWIAQRRNMAAMLFFLLSIFWYVKFVELAPLRVAAKQCTDHCPLSTAHSVHCYWLSLAAFMLAMLSKGSAAVLPMLLLGIIWWLRSLTRRDILRIAPFFLLAVVLTGANIWFQTHGEDINIRNAGFMERMLGAGGVVWFYLYKALLPINLAFIYPPWHIDTGNPLWWLPLLAALIVTAMLWWYRKGWSRPLLFAWGFFCVSLVPVLGFADVGFMKYSLVADHYQHIAIIGVIALAAAGWSLWHKRARNTAHWVATAVAVVAIGTLTFMTWQQSMLYRDKITLYQDTLEKNPGCWLAHNCLGYVLDRKGRLQDAIEHYRQALRLNPDYIEANNNLGNAFVQTGRLQEAIQHFELTLKLKPDFADTHNNLGVALVNADRLQEAIEHFEQALRLKPGYAYIYFNLALVDAKMQQSSEAIAAAQKGLELARSQGQEVQAKKIADWLNAYRASLSNSPNASPSSDSNRPAN
jgi:protein O-mannosyl-transferase